MSLGLISLLLNTAQAVPLSSVPAGGLVISEIMHDPVSVADFRGEYIEVHNTTSNEVDINGLIVSTANESGFTVNQTINVPAGGYVVLAASANSGNNGGNTEVDYQYSYSTFKLGKNDTVAIGDGTTTFDSVTYTSSGFPITAGAAMILDNSSLDSSSNDSASNWCTSGNVFGDGDFGTPGSANDGCSTVADIAVGDLVITEIMWDPTKAADYRGEWIEIYNASGGSLNLNGLVINSTGNSGHTISNDVVVPADEQVLLNVRSSSAVNGGTNGDYTYNYAEVNFGKNDSVSLVAGSTTVDSVTYTFSGYPVINGKSITLSPSTLSASSNDSASNWCEATSTYGDGDYGTPGNSNDVCANVDGDGDGLTAAQDCDDTDAAIGVFTYYLDADSDTYGDDSNTTTGCTVPAGYVEVGGDCDDARSDVNPDAIEVCDDIDNDCDNDIDDADSNVDTSTGTDFYIDSDNDTYGDDNTPAVQQCDAPANHVTIPGDCDDSDVNINPGATDIANNGIDENCDGVDNNGGDNDGDGFTVADGDCNDNNDQVFPGQTEICDSIDNDCDGDIDDDDSDVTGTTTFFLDNDGDGFAGFATVSACVQPAGSYTTQTDCNDSNASRYPNATEIVDNGIDEDCDNGDLCYVDGDDDGFRTESTVTSADLDCQDSGEGETSDALDCDDASASVNPNATEVCDGIDNDCDNDIDDADSGVDTSTGSTFFVDADNDLYGDANNSLQSCSRPAGYVTNSDDCDDTNNAIKPVDNDGDGVDRCNNDCDDTDEFSYPGAAESESATDCMTDADSDGYGDTTAPTGGVVGTDCDDSEAAANPGAAEVCDSIDNDCDGQIDINATDATSWYADSDADGFGDSGASAQLECTQPANTSANNTDCDDSDGFTFPGAAESDSSTDCMTDADEDGFGSAVAPAGGVAGNDCDDSDAATTLGQSYYADADNDGFGDSGATAQVECSQPANTSLDNTDCDDSDNTSFPGATEVCDNADNDCDGSIDEGVGGNNYYPDSDNDGFGDSTASPVDSCTAPANHVLDNSDCNDSDVNINPNATETCLDGVDSDCDNTDSLGTCEGTVANDDFTINGVSAGDRLGQALSYAGNVTGSSTNDFVLGSRWNGSQAGAVYVFAGNGSLSGSGAASTADVTITGQNSEQFGFSVAGGTNLLGGITSDFNGDGNDDLLVGAPNADVSGSSVGAAYMFYGPLSADTTSASADAVFTGQFGQDTNNPSNHNAVNTGYTVAFVGDINNDGIADIAIGDPSKKNSGSTNGEAYLIFGRADTFDGGGTQLTGQYEGTNSLNELSWRSTMGREILSDGTDREQMGAAIDAIGDVNGDGIDDLAIGAFRWDQSASNTNQNNGAVFGWYGGGSLWSQNLTDGNGNSINSPLTVSHSAGNDTTDFMIVGSSAGDQIGRSISGAGDFDGDGTLDIIIGSEHANSSAGLVMIVDGSGNTIATFTGESSGDAAGRWVSTLGDINGDGADDIIVGAKLADSNGTDSGATYIVLGGAGVTGTNSFGSAEVLLTGAAAGDETGMNVSGIDDMDGDGISEILIGSFKTGASEQGSVQLIFGNTFQ